MHWTQIVWVLVLLSAVAASWNDLSTKLERWHEQSIATDAIQRQQLQALQDELMDHESRLRVVETWVGAEQTLPQLLGAKKGGTKK